MSGFRLRGAVVDGLRHLYQAADERDIALWRGDELWLLAFGIAAGLADAVGADGAHHHYHDISWHKTRIFISEVFRFEELALDQTTPGFYRVYFRDLESGELNPEDLQSCAKSCLRCDECIGLRLTVSNACP
jgi:hypothetical protein